MPSIFTSLLELYLKLTLVEAYCLCPALVEAQIPSLKSLDLVHCLTCSLIYFSI